MDLQKNIINLITGRTDRLIDEESSEVHIKLIISLCNFSFDKRREIVTEDHIFEVKIKKNYRAREYRYRNIVANTIQKNIITLKEDDIFYFLESINKNICLSNIKHKIVVVSKNTRDPEHPSTPDCTKMYHDTLIKIAMIAASFNKDMIMETLIKGYLAKYSWPSVD
jgi:hypothetical protein